MPEQAYKRCTKCGEFKPLDEFHRESRATDGRTQRCKVCRRADKKAWTASRLARDPGYREVQRRQKREHYARNREAINARRESRDRWPRGPLSPEARERKRARDRQWKKDNREKTDAHLAVAQAIERHDLIRPIFCSECRKTCKHSEIQAHHEDYSKPLDVIWLCARCHKAKHPRRSPGPRSAITA